MKKICILVHLIIFFYGNELLFSGNDYIKVLMPDKKVGRNTEVLGNTVLVRIKKEFSENAENILKSYDSNIQIRKTIIQKSQSLTYNIDLRIKSINNKKLDIYKIIQSEEPLLRTFEINYGGVKAPEDFCRELLRNVPEVEIAEPVILSKLLEFIPNDPIVKAQLQDMLRTCNLFNAWDIEQGDTNVIIGISDSGVFQDHEDLKNSIAYNWADTPDDTIDNDGNGFKNDFAGFDLTGQNDPPDNTYNSNDHGTNVAGIAAATVNNEIGMAGTAFKCRFFPLKIAIGDVLIAAYESLVYAANNGFDVLNCSWGIVKPFSALDQSYINYAVAHDVAIVASGGNDMGSLENNYPAAYDGVLAVGEVDQYDIFSGNNIGAYLDILAPGGGNWYTTNDNDYRNFWSGSSYSAPVVSGILALVRARYPELTALQSIELVRQSADDVSNLPGNVFWRDILPGRVNAFKALAIQPFTIPSIRPKTTIYRNTTGVVSSRFAVGDSVQMTINAFNYLGEAKNLRFELSPVWDETESIKVVDSVKTLALVEREKELTIGEYKFVIKKGNREKMFFRCDISGENNYHDFFLIEFIPSPIVTTFSNDAVSFSVSDRGTIGFGGAENSEQGIGFIYKDKGNQLWKSCFIAADITGKVVSSLKWDMSESDDNDFNFLKPFISPDMNTGIFNDANANETLRMGIEVKQEFILPPGEHSIAKVNIEITNKSNNNIIDFTSGYYFDWDIYDSDSNTVELLTDAIPEGMDENTAAAEMVSFSGSPFPVFGNGVITYNQAAQVQLAGYNRDIYNIYIDSDRELLMNSGTVIQDLGIFDAAVFSGVKFPGAFAPDEKRKYSICFGAAENKEDFIIKMKKALDSTYTPVSDVAKEHFSVRIFPQPAHEYLNCWIETYQTSDIHISIVDLLGMEIYSVTRQIEGLGTLSLPINLTTIRSGTYFLRIVSDNVYRTFPITVIK